MLAAFRDWLRSPLRAHWSWPRVAFRTSERRTGRAQVRALRFTTVSGDELQVRNDGPGDAAEIVLTTLRRGPDEASRVRTGRLDYLGAETSYIVSLGPGGARLAPLGHGCWVRVQWRDPAASAVEPSEAGAFLPAGAAATDPLAAIGPPGG